MSTRRKIRLSPSILSADFARLGEQVREAEQAGADSIHIDVMDGRFVPNITFGPLVVRAVRSVTSLPLPTHLMIVEPERYIDDFVRSGSDWVIVHVETCPHLHRTLQLIRDLGARTGVALNPATPAAQLEEILGDVDSILVMTVNPGFGGQGFIRSQLRKIRQIREMLDQRASGAELMVDGGINTQTAPLVVAAGADTLGMGSAVFGPGHTVAQALARIRRSIEPAMEALG